VKGPNGKYWSAGSFSSTPEVFNGATGTTNWNYPLPLGPEGPYIVHVQATDTFGNAQAGTTYAASSSFSLDLTPPTQTPSITAGPTNGSLVSSTSASFSFSDSETGVATQCQLDGGTWGSCASPKSYSGLAQGTHTFSVRGVDGAGNPGPSSSRSWVVDTAAPPAPTLTDKPDDPNSSAISTFTWTDSESPLAFMCSVENGPYQACTSPFTFTVTVNTSNNGQHQFAVVAIDQAGNQSAPATYKWKVDGKQFTITGSLSDFSYPGRIAPLNLVITNPNNFSITVSDVTVTVESATSKAGCNGPSNLVVNHSLVGSVVVPANSSRSLQQLGVAQANWPELRFVDSAANQDVCKGALFTLDYTGSASK
jgi:predicted phage tail protein